MAAPLMQRFFDLISGGQVVRVRRKDSEIVITKRNDIWLGQKIDLEIWETRIVGNLTRRAVDFSTIEKLVRVLIGERGEIWPLELTYFREFKVTRLICISH